MKTQPIPCLTSLRFFAAAPIVFFHMQEPILHMDPNPAFAIGVSFFFVLSGFILTYAHQGPLSWRKFAISRASRLWPVHLVVAALWIIVSTKGNVSSANIGIPEVANLLLLQSWIPISAFIFSLNPVSWSISAEVFFYALFPFVRGKYVYGVFAATFILTVATVLILDSQLSPIPPGSGIDGQSILPLHIVLQFPPVRLSEFCLGIIAAQMFLSSPLTRNFSFLEVLAVCASVGAWFASEYLRRALISANYPTAAEWLSQTGGMPIFAFAIYVFAHQAGAVSRFLQSRVLVVLGEISFSTYMVHFLVLLVVADIHRSGTLSSTKAALVYIIATYFLSWVMWKLIEVPSKKTLQRVFWRPAY